MKNIFGININEFNVKMRKDLIIGKHSDYYFKSDNDGQLDLLVYVGLFDKVNYKNSFSVNINEFVTSIGYKPKHGEGKINSKTLKSFNRLNENDLIELNNDDKFIAGHITYLDLDYETFELNIDNLNKIIKHSKYTHKTKSMYLYCYILAYDYINNNLSAGILSKECNLTYEFTLKCIDKFHEDGLIDKKYISTSRTIKEEDKPYVYIHINKLNGEVLYVGKGRNERYCDLKSRNSKYTSFISEIGEDNIECKIIDYFDNDYSAYVYEYEIVSKYRAIGQAKYCIVLGNLEIKDGQ
jgi:hypothetical protein|nr:MAG TPA: GIY-YIG nuclease superfamily protein [Caudoviricetes sp.]